MKLNRKNDRPPEEQIQENLAYLEGNSHLSYFLQGHLGWSVLQFILYNYAAKFLKCF